MSISLRRSTVLVAATAALAVAAATGGTTTAATAADDRPVFSGQATALSAKILTLPAITVADTGYFEAATFAASTCTEVGVPPLTDQLRAEAEFFCSSTRADGNESASDSHIAALDATVAGIPVSATLLQSSASASCGRTGPVFENDEVNLADVRVGNVVVDLDAAVPTPQNQRIVLDPVVGSYIVVGERTTTSSGNYGSLTLTALRVVVPGVADVSFATVHVDVRCQGRPACPAPSFVTGGGFLSGKRHFTIGVRDGDLDWGHFMYSNKAAGLKVTGVKPFLLASVYDAAGSEGEGQLAGNAKVVRNGVAEAQLVPFRVRVSDRGEPGRSDTFELVLGGELIAAGPLEGGNLQAHRPCKTR